MNQQSYHFIGIGGIGMSALARILLERNMHVTGSDAVSSHVTEGLIKAGAKISVGHAKENVSKGTTVVYSTDIKKENLELQAAHDLQCPLLHRADLLALLMKGYKTLAVAGTHGKTTTSSLLTSVLVKAKADPSYAVGGLIANFLSNGGHGKGEYFVAEADESDGSFLKYSAFGGIVTNIDNDHLDHYGTEEALHETFKTFMSQVTSPTHLFWCGDDSHLNRLAMPGVTYGFGQHCALRGSRLRQYGWKTFFDVEFKGKLYRDIEVALPGRHSALNAMAVFGLSLSVGVPEAVIREALSTFQGVGRHCDKKGEKHGVLVLDDYGHHPTEVRETLKAIRAASEERRLIVVFQPHRYTRTRDCFKEFGEAFNAADVVFITDLYSAGEKPISGISYETILNEVAKTPGLPCHYLPKNEMVDHLAAFVRPHDVVVTMGAGDITKLGPALLAKLETNPPTKLKVGILCGGRSCEHEVSILSARNIAKCLSKDYYDVTQLGITKQGHWVCGKSVLKEDEVQKTSKQQPLLPPEVLQQISASDLIIPVLHGPFGEDGTLSGFFEILGKAYVGCDHRSAAICMDKALTKLLMISQGIETSPFIDFPLSAWQADPQHWVGVVKSRLKFPVFVKPVHLGSSVGVSKVESEQQLSEAIENAFKSDTRIVVEEGIVGREIEFSVLGNDQIQVAPPGEICTSGKVYDYEAKYGPEGMVAKVPADIAPEIRERGQRIAAKAYMAAGCTGLARVDFFLDAQGKFWLNEINPFPGFTDISVYPKAWEVYGFSPSFLIDRLIILGMQRKRFQDRYMQP